MKEFLVEIEEGILKETYYVADIDLDIAEKVVGERLSVMNSKSYKTLINISNVKGITKSARSFYKSEKGLRGYLAVAMVAKSKPKRLFAKMVIATIKPQFPTKFFSNNESALKWLQELQAVKVKTQNEQIDLIYEQMLKIAQGDFNSSLTVTEPFEDLDLVASGLNLISEELKDLVVSSNYFSGIYNSVSYPIFVINAKAEIKNFNKRSKVVFEDVEEHHSIIDFYDIVDKEDLMLAIASLKNEETDLVEGRAIVEIKGKEHSFLVSVSKIKTGDDVEELYLFSLKDITELVANENKIIKATIDTQNKERKRISADLHDSIGQELAAIKMMLSSLKNENDIEILKKNVEKCSGFVGGAIESVRKVSSGLLTSTLEANGFKSAVEELIVRTKAISNLDISYKTDESEEELAEDKQIALLRITEEFFSNTIKHAKASRIEITFEKQKQNYCYLIFDNGIGFESNKEVYRQGKSGLKNMVSRVRSCDGSIYIKSQPNNGCGIKILMR